MKPEWLIQTNIDDVDTDSMIAAVRSQGMKVHPVELHLGEQMGFGQYDSQTCTICYGSIDFVHQVQHRAPMIPGAWANFNHMKCSTYYAYLGKYLLNSQYRIIPMGELLRQWEKLAITTPCKSLFIRPDSGTKPFTGYVYKHDERHKIQLLEQSVGPETLVIVAPEKPITAEWRFVICDRKVVAGCQYLPVESTFCPPSSFRLAEIIATQEWQPDICYTIDIAESEGKMYLLEINSFSCAGFYCCEMSPIIEYASKAALNEWEEFYV